MSRNVFLFGPIEPEYVGEVIEKLLDFNNSSAPVNLFIQSDGGDIYSGLGILDIMHDVIYPINTIVVGKAFSIAADIAACGSERYMTKNSHIMFHNGKYEEIEGDVKAIKEESKSLEKLTKRIDSYLKKRLGKNYNSLKKKCNDIGDFYMDYKEAQQLGVVDGLFNKKIFKETYFGRPE